MSCCCWFWCKWQYLFLKTKTELDSVWHAFQMDILYRMEKSLPQVLFLPTYIHYISPYIETFFHTANSHSYIEYRIFLETFENTFFDFTGGSCHRGFSLVRKHSLSVSHNHSPFVKLVLLRSVYNFILRYNLMCLKFCLLLLESVAQWSIADHYQRGGNYQGRFLIAAWGTVMKSGTYERPSFPKENARNFLP